MRGGKATVIYDGECGLCLCTRKYVGALDTFHLLQWIPYQSEEAAGFGIPFDEMCASVHLVSNGRRWSGFAAVKQVLLRLPALKWRFPLPCSFAPFQSCRSDAVSLGQPRTPSTASQFVQRASNAFVAERRKARWVMAQFGVATRNGAEDHRSSL